MFGWIAAGVAGGATALAARAFRKKGLHRWLLPHLVHPPQRPDPEQETHVLLCVADHYEPLRGGVNTVKGMERVRRWVDEFPKLFDRFRDSDGRPPQHSFFYPEEEYRPEYLGPLAELCRAGFGEVEIHLHHDNDTAENLRTTLSRFRDRLANDHRLLSVDQQTKELSYGFIHGNWALDNSRCDGRWCGVNNELDVLRETGCYADFTMPSAPSETQTRMINSIYWAVDDPMKPKSHDRGILLGKGEKPKNSLLMIQGPLAIDWSRRKYRLIPRIENACLQQTQPPSAARLDLWIRAGVKIPRQPQMIFVKLHTHGAEESNMTVLLNQPMVRFHEHLADRAASNPRFRFHYVTAREMANLALAANEATTFSVADCRDWRYLPISRGQ